MPIDAWYVGNDMIVELVPTDALDAAIEGATVTVTMQHPDGTALTILGGAFTWPLDMPESPAGTYSVTVDAVALDINHGDVVRIVVTLDDGSDGDGQWVTVGRVVERLGI